MKLNQYRQQKMRKVCMALPFCLFTFLPFHAQTFTQQLQQNKIGEGIVTLHQSQDISDLVNGPAPAKPAPKATPKPEPKQKQKQKPAPKPTPNNQQPTPEKKPETPPQENEHQEQEAEQQKQETDTIAPTPRRAYRATGYRVQAFAGGNTRRDRQRADRVERTLREAFPSEKVYVHFYSPRWVCRLGNYRTYEEAREKLLEVRKLGYESATIVKGKITLYEY